MQICPIGLYKINNSSYSNKNKPQNKSDEFFAAKKPVQEEKQYYDYLKASVLFKGKNKTKSREYLSSKYLYISRKSSILNRGEKIRLDKTDYSKEDIQNILAEKTADKKTAVLLTNYLEGVVNENNPDSSYIKKLLELVYADKLPAGALLGLQEGLSVNQNIKQDIDKLFECYRTDKSVADAFVPTFKTKDEANSSLSVGDVCQIEGEDRISIKKDEGEIEKLFISKNTYLELFPPVERFLYTQSNQQDCYFISVFDSIYSNPHSRYKILGLFNERKNGKVDASFGGFKYTGSHVSSKDFSRYVLRDLSKTLNSLRRIYPNYMSYTMEGLRALEVLNAEEKRKNAESKINKKYHYYKKLLEKSEHDPIVCKDFQYSRDELVDFINLYESQRNQRNIISTEDMNIPVFDIDYGSVLYGLKLLDENKTPKTDTKWERYILERYKEYLERTGKKTVPFKEVIPIETYQDIFQWEINKNTPSPYTYGGNSFSAFRVFDLPSMLLPLCDNETTEKLLNMQDIQKRAVLTCSTPYEDKTGRNIKPFHSYSLIPKDENGKRTFIVKNPINTFQQIELTKEELKECFNVVELGLIEPLSFNLP